MENVSDLLALLAYNLQNLHAAENIQIAVLPSIIGRVQHRSLKNALTHHLGLTKEHRNRLQQIPEMINARLAAITNAGSEETIKPVKEKLEEPTCKGMQGLVDEANELLESGLNETVTDAAIISAIQKMEHYEICAYGTTIAFAKQLDLLNVEALLAETLNEEYDADDLLTSLATASLNKKAEPEAMQAAMKASSLTSTDDYHAEKGTGTKEAGKVVISERTVNAPGGRAGTSHRRYQSGESRGH